MELKDIEKVEKEEPAATKALSPEDLRITDEIQRSLGLKVKMSRSSPDQEGGKLIIEFYSHTDLQELFRKLVADPM